MSRNSPRTAGTGRVTRLSDGPSPSPRSREGSASRSRKLSITEPQGNALPPPPIRSLDPFTSPKDGRGMDVTMMSPDPLSPSSSMFPPPSSSTDLYAQKPPSASTDSAQTSSGDSSGSDCWVTVFGFCEGERAGVLQELQKCGEVLEVVPPPPGSPANWLHLRFSSKYAASIAARKNGTQLFPGLIIGVLPLDSKQLKDIAAGTAQRGDQGMGSSGAVRGGTRPASAVAVRPYHLNASLPNGGIPQPSRTTWNKVAEYVFGM